MRKKVLVTAVGSFSSAIVITNLKKCNYSVIGMGVFEKELVAESILLDEYYKVPYAFEKDSYLEKIYKICEKEKISFLIPLTDVEIDLINVNRQWFEKHHVVLCISDMETIELCRDKMKLAEYLSANKSTNMIPTIKLRDIKEMNFQFPIICKPKDGRSSEGLHYIESNEELEHCMNHLDSQKYLVQPYIKGDIVTVDIVRQRKGKQCVAISRKELIRNHRGAGLSVKIFRCEVLEALCINIAEKLKVVGCVNFEFILDENGIYHFMECNPRFSGGVSFSCMAGYDCISNHMRCFEGEDIEKYTYKKDIYIARRYEDYITKGEAI